MNIKTFIAAMGIAALLGVGCSSSSVPPKSIGAEQFSFTSDPQDAIFHIGFGWTGGMGSMPLVFIASGQVKKYEDLPIYFDENYKNNVKTKLPVCYVGTPRIQIGGNITLSKQTDTNDSIEDAPVQSYYIARVNRLDFINVQAETCEE